MQGKKFFLGYENSIYDSINLNEVFCQIESSLSERSPEKYASFLEMMKKTKFLLKLLGVKNISERVELLYTTYFFERIIDDIGDHDLLKDISDNERTLIIKNITNDEYGSIPLLQSMYDKIVSLSSFLGIGDTYISCINQINRSIQTDLDRILSGEKSYSKREVDDNIMLETKGTTVATCMIFGIEPGNVMEVIGELTYAARIAYNVRDLPRDIQQGKKLLPSEDMIRFNISDKDVASISSENDYNKIFTRPDSIQAFVSEQINEIEALLNKYHKTYNIKKILLQNSGLKFEGTGMLKNMKNNIIMKYALKKLYHDEINEILSITQSSILDSYKMGLNMTDQNNFIKDSIWGFIVQYYNIKTNNTLNNISQKVRSLCDTYKDELELSSTEFTIFYSKAKNLSLLYQGIVGNRKNTNNDVNNIAMIGFFSAVFDVCSDWGKDLIVFREKFSKIMKGEIDIILHDQILTFFDKDITGKLGDYGLERGSISTSIICGLLSYDDDKFRNDYGVSINEMGRYLQMVDDILDVEEDILKGKENFLKYCINIEFLQKFLVFFEKKYFTGTLMQLVINQSVKKGKKLLRNLSKD